MRTLGYTCPSHSAILSPSLLFTTQDKSIIAASQRKPQYMMHTIKDIRTLVDSAGAGKLSCVTSIVLSNLLNTSDKSNVLSMYTESYDNLIHDDYHDMYTDSVSTHLVYDDYDNTDLSMNYYLHQCADVTNPADVVGT